MEAWEGVGELEIQFQQLKTLITGSCNLVHDLKRASDPAANAEEVEKDDKSQPKFAPLTNQSCGLEEALEDLDVAIAERDLSIIGQLLQNAEECAIEVRSDVPQANRMQLGVQTGVNKHKLHIQIILVLQVITGFHKSSVSSWVGFSSFNELGGGYDSTEKGKCSWTSRAPIKRSYCHNNGATQAISGACRSRGRCPYIEIPVGNTH